MTYELAKQLKDAGFPDSEYIIPALSDLIEACGDKFVKLEKVVSGWSARGTQGRYKDPISDQMVWGGINPEEAVAKLWLALNKHE